MDQFVTILITGAILIGAYVMIANAMNRFKK